MKLEQIAIATDNPGAVMQAISGALGINMAWSQDIVVANATVMGSPDEIKNKAELNFNYDLGFELEVLHYLEGDNWHKQRVLEGATFPFLSHIGYHCTEEECQQQKNRMAAMGIGIAQEVFTESHTNPVIAGKRLYHYVVFDSKDTLGFDLKLIVRRDV